MLTKKELKKFEALFREYFDPEVMQQNNWELPDQKYLHRWAEQHGNDLLTLLHQVIPESPLEDQVCQTPGAVGTDTD